MSLHQRLFRARTGVVLAVCLATVVALTACGSSSTSSKSASSSSSGGSASSGTAGSATRSADTGTPVNVAIELVQNGLAFTQETQAGAQAAAQQFNAHLSVSAPTQLDPTTAISQVNSALSQGAKGIALRIFPHRRGRAS